MVVRHARAYHSTMGESLTCFKGCLLGLLQHMPISRTTPIILSGRAEYSSMSHSSEITIDSTRIFSLLLGTMFCGIGLGPVIGGILIRTTGSSLSPFYLAATAHALYAAYVFLIVPESQTKARAMGARQRRQELFERQHEGVSRAKVVLKSVVWFFSPLAVLLPERVIVDGNPLKRPKRDWSLCFIAASYGFTTSLMV